MAEEVNAITKHLVPGWKQVLCKAYVVWVAAAATIIEILMYIAENLEQIQMYIPDKYKFWFRLVVGIAIIALRPVQQRNLAKLRARDDSFSTAQKGASQ